MEAASARVQDEATKIFTDLDKEIVRKMQGDMYRCSAKCCDNVSGTMDQVQRCIENCSQPLNKAQNFIQGEVENFQSRLNRCAMDCQDKARDRVSSDMSVSDREAVRMEMETCVTKCADSHIKLLPDLYKRIKANLSKNQY